MARPKPPLDPSSGRYRVNSIPRPGPAYPYIMPCPGKHLAEVCKAEYPVVVKYCLWLLAEVAVIAADIPEVIGTAFALNILFHIPVWAGVLLTGLSTLLLLGLQRYGVRKLELLIAILVFVMAACFFGEMAYAKPPAKDVLKGLFIPKLNGNSATADAIALMGALVMPHNLFLHSALVLSRKVPKSVKGINEACKFFLWESGFALFIALLINIAVISVSGSACYSRSTGQLNPQCNDLTLNSASFLLQNVLGRKSAKILYAMILSFELPFALIPLLKFSSGATKMGPHKNSLIMDQENTNLDASLPPYAVGTKILLIDPDVTSLKHTTSMLEESTYRVTGIEIPEVALSMMKEKAHGYDLIITAANMPGIDCLTYLKSLMALSETPIVLISYVADFQLIATALRQGISHFLEKPIKRDEARGLWQFVIRKPRKITPKKAKNDSKHNKDIVTSNKAKGKGKDIVKRKRIDDGKRDYNLYKAKKNIFISNGTGTGEDNNENNLKWNPQLHEKFMTVLNDGKSQGQTTGTKDTTVTVQPQPQPQPLPLPQPQPQPQPQPRPAHHLQGSDKETNKHTSGSPNAGMRANATPINNNNNNNLGNSGTIMSRPRTPINNNNNNLGNSGTIMSRPRTPNLLQNSNILRGNVPNFYGNHNNQVQMYTSAPCNNNNNSFILTSYNYGNSGNSMANGLSVDPKPQLMNKQQVSFGSSEKKSILSARIDQIRHEYWTKEDKLNEPVISDEELDMLLDPDFGTENEKQTNDVHGNTIPELGDINFDDIFLDEIFAEV
ncbi:hypothetical protein KSS87_002489 [Heliosperma pusillum]|nr:hypothetical protein KSS87_002489 [Heliosperma pusillum]